MPFAMAAIFLRTGMLNQYTGGGRAVAELVGQHAQAESREIQGKCSELELRSFFDFHWPDFSSLFPTSTAQY
jgi:hypothetical protein